MNVSFINSCGPELASYRYRAAIPARELGASINDLEADVLVFTKPLAEEVALMLHARAKAYGRRIIADFCDDHFDKESHYTQFARFAHAITVPTEAMRLRVPEEHRGKVTVIPDPYEFEEVAPHCAGTKLLWFGHGSNLNSLLRVIRSLDDYPLTIVSNSPMALPWSLEEMRRQFALADIVVIPATADYKSANRAIESIRQGCMVVAEPHPSLEGIPGIWVGNLKEGIEWTASNLQSANERITQAQNFLREGFSPRTLANAWRSLFEKVRSPLISDAEKFAGMDGSASIWAGKAVMALSMRIAEN